MLIKCDSEHVEQFSNSLHFCIAGGFKEDCVGILSLRFFKRKNVMWLVEDEKVLTIYFSRFHTTPACFRQTVCSMQSESHVTVLTTFTVSAGKAWQAGARVISIRKIFITRSSVYAVLIVVALVYCNINGKW